VGFGAKTVVISGTPSVVVSETPTGTPISRTGRYSGTSTSYQTVAEWEVSAGKVGNLEEVSLVTDQVAKTHWRLTVGGVQQWADRLFYTSLSIPWRKVNTQLPAGAKVTLEAKSTDGTSIIADGSISGIES